MPHLFDPELNPIPKNKEPNNDDFIIRRSTDLDQSPQVLQIEDDDDVRVIPAIK